MHQEDRRRRRRKRSEARQAGKPEAQHWPGTFAIKHSGSAAMNAAQPCSFPRQSGQAVQPGSTASAVHHPPPPPTHHVVVRDFLALLNVAPRKDGDALLVCSRKKAGEAGRQAGRRVGGWVGGGQMGECARRPRVVNQPASQPLQPALTASSGSVNSQTHTGTASSSLPACLPACLAHSLLDMSMRTRV